MNQILLVGAAFIFFSLSCSAEDWKTTDGQTYKGVNVIKHDNLTVTILDDDGGATIPLANLPADLQKKFDYDPAKAAAQVQQQAAQQAQQAQASILDGAKYDKFKDYTTLSSPDFPLRDNLKLIIILYNSGSTLVQPTSFHFQIIWTGKDWRYIHNSEIIFLADDTRISQDNGFDKDGLVDNGFVVESITIDLKPDEMKSLANAKTLALSAGGIEEQLPDGFQDYCKKLYDASMALPAAKE